MPNRLASVGLEALPLVPQAQCQVAKYHRHQRPHLSVRSLALQHPLLHYWQPKARRQMLSPACLSDPRRWRRTKPRQPSQTMKVMAMSRAKIMTKVNRPAIEVSVHRHLVLNKK